MVWVKGLHLKNDQITKNAAEFNDIMVFYAPGKHQHLYLSSKENRPCSALDLNAYDCIAGTRVPNRTEAHRILRRTYNTPALLNSITPHTAFDWTSLER